MRTLILLLSLLSAGPLVAAVDDFRVLRLEQDIRTLEREVQTLRRLVSELQQRAQRTDPTYQFNVEPSAQAAETNDGWLKASAWKRLRVGMSELEVIEILGKPTALRPDPQNRRALLYSLEIGTTNFLSGAVSFSGGKVVDIQQPALK